MEIISKQQFLGNKARYLRKIVSGAVFIYPTDTIYGIGCDATNPAAVARIRKIKHRSSNPFSVAVPSEEWIYDNCIVSREAKQWLQRLPGPYTLLLKLKNKKAVAASVNPNTQILGIRIPKNWFAKVVSELDMPIVSTSANITSKSNMTSMKNLNPDVAKKVDFIIYEGKKEGRPSSIVQLYAKKSRVFKR